MVFHMIYMGIYGPDLTDQADFEPGTSMYSNELTYYEKRVLALRRQPFPGMPYCIGINISGVHIGPLTTAGRSPKGERVPSFINMVEENTSQNTQPFLQSLESEPT